MKKLFLILFLLSMILTASSFAQKTALHWYLPTLNEDLLDNIAQYDLIIVDPEVKFNSSKKLDYIMRQNHKTKIILYFNPVEWFVPMYSDKPWSIKILQELKKKKSWWLKQQNGEPVVFWTGSDGRQAQMINMSVDCPEIDGLKYYQFIANKVLSQLLSDKRFSGILIDNAWTEISWLANYGNNHGLKLKGAKIDSAWRVGFYKFVEIIRKEKGKDFIIITNPGNLAYLKITNGEMFENFPQTDFRGKKKNNWFEIISSAKRTGPYTIFNAQANNYFFTLVSSMLLDNVYFSNQQNEPYHDYYRLNLGKAKGKMTEISPNLFTRRFKKGTIFVQIQEKKAWIEYKNGVKR